jgi:hypothetical protein
MWIVTCTWAALARVFPVRAAMRERCFKNRCGPFAGSERRVDIDTDDG